MTKITRGKPGQARWESHKGIVIWRPAFLPLYPIHVHLHGLIVNGLIRELDSKVDLYHLHTPLPPVLNTKRPIVLTFHTCLSADIGSIPLQSIQSLLVKLQLPISQSIERQLLARATRVTAVAGSVANELHEYGISPQNVRVMGNGVDPQVFLPPTTGPEDSELLVLAAGRLGMRKGLEDLIACARIVRDQFPLVRFAIAGEGPLMNLLQRQIVKAGLDGYVRLLGYVGDRDEMAALYRQATLFVHPAHYEGLPTVLLEAMACARPVVATSVSGALDVITSGENGILIPPRDPTALAQALLALLRDPALREYLGRNARKTIEDTFSWDRVSEQYLACYSQVLRGQG